MITRTQINLFSQLPENIQGKIAIDAETGCWNWLGVMNRNGYGRAYFEGKYRAAHRVIWRLLGRPLIDAHVLDHCCRNRACCNPTHVSPVTVRQNTHRGKAKLMKRTNGTKNQTTTLLEN